MARHIGEKRQPEIDCASMDRKRHGRRTPSVSRLARLRAVGPRRRPRRRRGGRHADAASPTLGRGEGVGVAGAAKRAARVLLPLRLEGVGGATARPEDAEAQRCRGARQRLAGSASERPGARRLFRLRQGGVEEASSSQEVSAAACCSGARQGLAGCETSEAGWGASCSGARQRLAGCRSSRSSRGCRGAPGARVERSPCRRGASSRQSVGGGASLEPDAKASGSGSGEPRLRW